MKIFPSLSNVILLNVLFILSSSSIFSQSKKEQIEILTNRVDSLNSVVVTERNINKQKSDKILEQSENISELKETTGNLAFQLSKLNESIKLLNQEITEKENRLSSKAFEISVLETQLKEKMDSLTMVRSELEKLKPAPKPLVVNNSNANSSANTNSSNQVKQTGSYKSVKIGNQTWMAENLNVSTFRNGDPIPQAKTNEEWEKAGKDGRPAWCYYENDPKNGAKYGKLYNWHAVNDSRGLAPTGWHIPTDAEWTTLDNQLGDAAGKKMKSTSGWDSWEEDLTCKNCQSWNAEYRKKTACHVCKDTRVNGKKTHSGNGTNSSGFSGLPGGYRGSNGYSNDIGVNGYWWSASEGSTLSAYYRSLSFSSDYLSSFSYFKVRGLSVRCLRD